ncbi:50S ribosomal protein L9 [Candidatus Chromulinivorax destructor]|uniref:Large ribosomal subunit protein bL9 n=1 Tax=Candidatus Chromulinivorax destructor TaxID=2066483 RepID=A0A345ZAB2_9BACT|nr:50S ribosomal protein L9 [Candidatus Chromulinivorax destructor]AXK60229.1 50S ribosomal protein L9 [Candidatus Chromulinivorax destructor]
MNVFLLKNIVHVGLKNEIIKVSSGYAKNFLFPNKLAVEVTKENEALYKEKARNVQNRAAIIDSTASLLADEISKLSLKIKKTVQDNNKLYAAISSTEVVDLLKEQNITIEKNQVIFEKAIKEKGTFMVTIKLSPKVQTQFTLQVIA